MHNLLDLQLQTVFDSTSPGLFTFLDLRQQRRDSHSLSILGQVPRHLGETPVGAIHRESGAGACPRALGQLGDAAVALQDDGVSADPG